jgi:uncharacterized membrane protein YoaK (UPF0700 family)
VIEPASMADISLASALHFFAGFLDNIAYIHANVHLCKTEGSEGWLSGL